jgi:1,4-alpha-glucan branching enzyme
MIERHAMDAEGRVRVTFVLADGGIDGHVAVVGYFNVWDPTASPLRKQRGRRITSVSLVPGRRYAFRYLAEGGQWFNDEAADDYQPNEFGGTDSVIDLSERP